MRRWAILAAAMLMATPALAWDTNTHKVIGVIAYRHLTLQARTWCDRILASNPRGYRDFLNAAPYPDYLKHGPPKDKPRIKLMRRFNGWHFIDYPIRINQSTAFPYDTSVEKNGNNALFGISESVRQVTSGPADTRGLYLSMILHVVGDVHQPLHCAEREGDKGGNDVALRGALQNLHSLWDGAITAKYRLKGKNRATDARIETVAQEVEAAFPLDSMREEVAELDPHAWAEESYALAVDSAYDGLTPQTKPTPAYQQRWTAVAERRVALAGYRLAGFLNRLAARG
ncbi:hypothetical protein EON82_05045 [bacterium]|nr:MAG: hypothetical protein EON82_05045 [bacterium]